MTNSWSWYYTERVTPNIGILTEDQQSKLHDSCIGIAGCGAIGGHSASELVYWGIGSLKLADFDVFETSNANRQLFSGFSNVGKEKVNVVAVNVKDIEPDIKLKLYPQGITFENVDDFVCGCDVVIDAIDYEKPQFSIALHRAARKVGIPVFVSQCIGYGASVFAFYSDSESYEDFLGIDPSMPIANIDFSQVDLLKLCPIMPDYIDKEILRKVLEREMEAPTVISGQTFAVGLTVSNLVIQIVDQSKPRLRMCAFDPFKGQYIESRY